MIVVYAVKTVPIMIFVAYISISLPNTMAKPSKDIDIYVFVID